VTAPEPPTLWDTAGELAHGLYADDRKPWQRSAHEQVPTPFERGMEGSTFAGYKWSVLERDRIDAAILRCAHELREFTADAVWERAPSVPVTKGLAGRLNAAVHSGLIESTGRVAFAARGGEHDHRQRLAVWRSLVFEVPA
jgi:hypothetical protein